MTRIEEIVNGIYRIRPEWTHTMHAGTLTGDFFPRFARALREQQSAFRGMLFAPAVMTRETAVS